MIFSFCYGKNKTDSCACECLHIVQALAVRNARASNRTIRVSLLHNDGMAMSCFRRCSGE